jgi:hypothetical protein
MSPTVAIHPTTAAVTFAEKELRVGLPRQAKRNQFQYFLLSNYLHAYHSKYSSSSVFIRKLMRGL